jgi:hypothetical protein
MMPKASNWSGMSQSKNINSSRGGSRAPWRVCVETPRLFPHTWLSIDYFSMPFDKRDQNNKLILLKAPNLSGMSHSENINRSRGVLYLVCHGEFASFFPHT